MNNIMYIGAILCFGLFMLIGNGIMGLGKGLPWLKELCGYLGLMSVGLGIFSSSVLVFLAKSRIN